jgi:hypothetical protein
MNKKFIISLFPVLAVALVVIGSWMYVNKKSQTGNEPTWASITTFEECAKLYPIMESYPEQCKTPDGRNFVRDISGDLKDLIVVDSPKANDVVSSPLVVTGKARGNWFFEASFPVSVEDADGMVLGTGIASTKEEWMTTEFVSFSAQIDFSSSPAKTGMLVLKKDNPSGLPEHDKELRIPIQFNSVSAGANESFDKEVVFGLGKTVVFSDGLSVTLTKINDSRCKPDVQCIWAGELAPVLTVSGGRFAKSLQEIQLGTVNNTSVTQKEYKFSLLSATEESAKVVITSVK